MSMMVQIEAAMVSKSFLVMLMVFPRLEGEGDDGDRTGQEEDNVEGFFNQVHGVSVAFFVSMDGVYRYQQVWQVLPSCYGLQTKRSRRATIATNQKVATTA